MISTNFSAVFFKYRYYCILHVYTINMKRQLFCIVLAATILACNNKNAASTSEKNTADGFVTAKGEFYCEGMVAADGLGCMIKIDGVVYKMEKENTEMYEENAIFDKAGKAVQMEVVYKKTGKKFKMMSGSDGPEMITIKSVKVIE
jgi:hypothetical protein